LGLKDKEEKLKTVEESNQAVGVQIKDFSRKKPLKKKAKHFYLYSRDSERKFHELLKLLN
jgi:cell division protein FtsL